MTRQASAFPHHWIRKTLPALLLVVSVMTVQAQTLPPRTPDGFLSHDAGMPEYVLRDPDAGHWLYLSPTLQVEIARHEDPQAPLIWFETDITLAPGEKLTTYVGAGKQPGSRLSGPEEIARAHQVVLGTTDDFFSHRLLNHEVQGIIVRNGSVLSNKTYRADHASLPNLETLAAFDDGSLDTFTSDAYTGEEYLAMGARDVFAFGPILVQDGHLGPHMQEEDYYHYREPRCALGMISPNHYLLLTVRGRADNSRGAYLDWLARKMLELGAVEALNLDGGGSVALVFMGDIIDKPEVSHKNIRHVGSIIGFGTSTLVPTN